MKRKLTEDPDLSARRAYNWSLNQLTVADASVVAPLASVERSLQRHKVKNRPELPNTRQDWILQPDHSITLDGRPFVLIDNGILDRIIVFGTERNLERCLVLFIK
jgi:hypothetical protein